MRRRHTCSGSLLARSVVMFEAVADDVSLHLFFWRGVQGEPALVRLQQKSGLPFV
jgi:hypothetical protein